eukprot:TRINITY_DN9714_c0_g1_i1.p1 TRINITY_DN9714_c0_g1~~TRINITY_DN9714_c0_g1_i1.p1  ORF type:complete len:291 (-),score=66.15 TRINITY_DN9714_c0_g1_i1:5-877(-)
MDYDVLPPGVRSVQIALVVIRKDNKFVSVEESDGWYLPAGRVDYGEIFSLAAVRETQEEAGIPVRVTGIYKIQHSRARCRVIFGAEPVDNTPLKSIPDHETLKAEWVTTEQLKAKKLRSKEVLEIFSWVEAGAPLYPLSLFEGTNGDEIDNKNVITFLVHLTKLIIRKGDRFVGVQDSQGKVSLPTHTTEKNIVTHKSTAKELLKGLNLGDAQVTGFVKLEHYPPKTKAYPSGTITFTLLAEAQNWDDFKGHTYLPQQFCDKEAALLSGIIEGTTLVAPIDILGVEGGQL